VLAQLGLDEPADRLARTYSGGMRRRLDLGASLVGRPRLLLLDEPTTGLDPRSRMELWDAIRVLVRRGTDVLLTTPYLDEADQLASRIVIIDHGRAVATGTPGELKRRIGSSVVELHVRSAGKLPRAAAILGGRAELDESTRRLTMRVDPGGDALIDAVREAGIEVEDVGLRQPNLDEVLLALTGSAPDAGDPAAARAA